jgi:hypothetical protein
MSRQLIERAARRDSRPEHDGSDVVLVVGGPVLGPTAQITNAIQYRNWKVNVGTVKQTETCPVPTNHSVRFHDDQDI